MDKMKEEFYIDIWELIDIEDVNNILDEQVYNKGINPVDITYKCKSIDKNGRVLVEAEFDNLKE